MSTDLLSLEWTPNGTNGRITVTAKLDETVLAIDTLNVLNAKARAKYADQLSEARAGIDRSVVEAQLLAIAGEVQKESARASTPEAEEDHRPLALSKKALAETEGDLIGLAKDFLNGPGLIEKIVGHIGLLGVAGEEDLAMALYLIGTSRLLPKPLAGITMGASSAGKSYVSLEVKKLFPPEATLHAHHLSPKALQYMRAGTLVHRFVVAGERSRKQDDDAAEATRALREMISDGKLSAAIAVKGNNNRYETVEIHQDGPIAYVESTTLGISQIFDEDRTRCLLLSSDESQDQTAAVVRQLAHAATGERDGDTPDSVIALHHAAQRLLEAGDVVVPFAGTLAKGFPVHRLEVRRTFTHLLSLVKAVALLHQYQRDKDDQGRIIATPSDYDVVRSRLVEPLGRSLGCELTAGAKQIWEILADWSGEFTVSDVTAKVDYCDNTVRGRFKELIARGQIVKLSESRGQKGASYAVAEDRPALTGLALPEIKPNVTATTEAVATADNA